jgi:hypothetical protein
MFSMVLSFRDGNLFSPLTVPIEPEQRIGISRFTVVMAAVNLIEAEAVLLTREKTTVSRGYF